MRNHNRPTLTTSATSPRPTRKNGTVLPTMNSTGRIGVTMICSSVPTSRSRTMAKAVRLTTMISVSVPITPGTKNQRPLRSGLNQGRCSSVTCTCRMPRAPCVALHQVGGVILGEAVAICVDIAERNQRGVGIGAVDDDRNRGAVWPLRSSFGEAGVNDDGHGGVAGDRWRH